jgi:hypothetical protein
MLQLVSIRVAELEVISEYKGEERVSLHTDPIVLDLNWHKMEWVKTKQNNNTILLSKRIILCVWGEISRQKLNVMPNNFDRLKLKLTNLVLCNY